jgi:hypothetical protein
VILIQDLHAHLDTQCKIIGLLKFYESHGMLQRPIALEGTYGVWDLSAMTAFPIKERKAELFDYLLKEAGLTGPEWFALNTNRPKLLYGVDSAPDYNAQRELFRQTRVARDIAAKQVELVQSSLQSLASRTFKGKLKEWKKLTDRFDAGQLYGDVYLKALVSLGSRVHVLPTAVSLQNALSAKSSAEIADLAASDRFYSDLRKYGQEVGIRLARSPAEANMVKACYAADLIKRLLRQQLTLEEIRQIASRQQGVAKLAHDLIEGSAQPSWFDVAGLLELIRSATDFYVAALVRDEPLARNTVRLLDAQGSGLGKSTAVGSPEQVAAATAEPRAVILVAGGFHTLGITRELKKLGVSYEVITPNITAQYTPEDEARYAARLSGEPVSLKGLQRTKPSQQNSPQAMIESPQAHSANILLGPEPPAKMADAQTIRSMYGPEVAAYFIGLLKVMQRVRPDITLQEVLETLGLRVGARLDLASLPEGAPPNPILAAVWEAVRRYPADRSLTPHIRAVCLLEGQINYPVLKAAIMVRKADGHYDKIPPLEMETVLKMPVVQDPERFDVGVHDIAVGYGIQDFVGQGRYASPEVQALMGYALLFKEQVDGSTDREILNFVRRPDYSPETVSHEDLETYGATWERVMESLRRGTANAFLDRAQKELDVDWRSIHRSILDQNRGAPARLSAAGFVGLVARKMRQLRDGQEREVHLIYNNKNMIRGMQTAIIDVDNARLSKKYNGHIDFRGVGENVNERTNDFAGLMGIYKKHLKANVQDILEGRAGLWVLVPDGGFKTRFLGKGLTEGYTSQTTLPGTIYGNEREAVFLHTLVLADFIPSAERYIWLNGNDNLFYFGDAHIGGVALDSTPAGRAKLEEALKGMSLLNGGPRIELLDEADKHALAKLSDEGKWTDAMVRSALDEDRPGRWDEILQAIEAGKLYEIGLYAATRDGEMTDFREKIDKNPELVKFVFEVENRKELAYANPFQQVIDPRLWQKIYDDSHQIMAKTQEIEGLSLDNLMASYMTVIFQARMIHNKCLDDPDDGRRQWNDLTRLRGSIHPDDWAAIYDVSNRAWDAEVREGRGKIKILDFGPHHYWVDLAHLSAYRQFIWQTASSARPEDRRRFGMHEEAMDRTTVKTVGTGQIRLSEYGDAYLDRVIATNVEVNVQGGSVDQPTFVENVIFTGRPGMNDVINIPPGAIIRNCNINLNHFTFSLPDGRAIVENVFPIGGVREVSARNDERVGVLVDFENVAELNRSVISLPPGKIIGDLMENAGYQRFQQLHPELLSNIPYEQAKSETLLTLPITFRGKAFKPAQRLLNYPRMRAMVRELDTRINDALGIPEKATNVVSPKSDHLQSRRWAAVLSGIAGVAALLAVMSTFHFLAPVFLGHPVLHLTSTILASPIGLWGMGQVYKLGGHGSADYVESLKDGKVQRKILGADTLDKLAHEVTHAAGEKSESRTEWLYSPIAILLFLVYMMTGSVSGAVSALFNRAPKIDTVAVTETRKFVETGQALIDLAQPDAAGPLTSSKVGQPATIRLSAASTFFGRIVQMAGLLHDERKAAAYRRAREYISESA